MGDDMKLPTFKGTGVEALALSSAEVEYRGDVNVVVQEVWLHGILIEFRIHTSPRVDIYCDNQSTIKISSDPLQK